MTLLKSKKEISFYSLTLVFVSLIAILIRTIGFGSVPGGFNQDGAMAAVDAAALAKYGTDRYGMFMPVHLTAWGFGQMSCLMSYLMVPFIWLFGLNVFTARLPILICSVLGLACLYFFSKSSFSKGTALAVLAFAAVDPWHIMQSRWALDCNLFPHFLMAAMCFLLLGVNNGSRPQICVSMVLFGLSMYCYGISIYNVPVLLIILSVYLLRRKKVSLIELALYALVYLLIAWPFIACMIINAFGLDTVELPFCTIPFFPYSMRSSDILFFSDSPLLQLRQNFLSITKIIFQCSGDPLHNEIPGFGTMYFISVPFFLAGLFFMVRDERKSTGGAFTLIFLLCGFINGLITNGVNINRACVIFYPMIIITGYGIYRTVKRVRLLSLAVPLLYCTAFAFFCYSYFTYYADNISGIFMEDFGQAVTYAASLDGDKIYITPNSQYTGSSHVSEILTLYYADIDAKDYQSGAFADKYSFYDQNNADVLVTDQYEPGAVQFGRFYVIERTSS